MYLWMLYFSASTVIQSSPRQWLWWCVSRLSSSWDPVIVNFEEIDDWHSCKTGTVLIFTNIGKRYLHKKKKDQVNKIMVETEKAINLGPEEIYQKPMDSYRKDDQENRYGEAETRNIFTSKNCRTDCGYPLGISRLTMNNIGNCIPLQCTWVSLPFTGGPPSMYLFSAVFYFLPCCNYGKFWSCSSTFQSSLTHTQRAAWQLLYLRLESRWIGWKCSHLYKHKPTSF